MEGLSPLAWISWSTSSGVGFLFRMQCVLQIQHEARLVERAEPRGAMVDRHIEHEELFAGLFMQPGGFGFIEIGEKRAHISGELHLKIGGDIFLPVADELLLLGRFIGAKW